MEVAVLIQMLFLCALVLGGARAIFSRDRGALLMGGVLTTVGIVGVLWCLEINAATALLAVIFIIFDFVLFSFSGATKLLPSRSVSGTSLSRVYSTTVIWFLASMLIFALYFIWGGEFLVLSKREIDHGQLIGDVMASLWGAADFSIYLIVALICGAAIGAFFMIEREK